MSVCVVDAASDDYGACLTAADETGIRLQIVPNAADALRLARSTSIDLWIVNVNLPGLGGDDLCGMLRSRPNRPQVHLVADEYSAEAEQAAFRSRATLFACKAPHLAWLRDWIGATGPNSASPIALQPTIEAGAIA